jgi:SsrA-binding protein
MQDNEAKNLEDRKVARNRQARHEFFILESLEVGIVLAGTEIKSIRAGHVNLKDGFARVDNGELWLYNVHISPYEMGTRYNKEPLRPRKLLAHRSQILKLQMKIREKGLTLVPLSMYLKEGRRAKIDLAIAKGKQEHDKRDSIAERDVEREINRTMRERARRDY